MEILFKQDLELCRIRMISDIEKILEANFKHTKEDEQRNLKIFYYDKKKNKYPSFR